MFTLFENPAVKGVLWGRIGTGLKFVHLLSQKRTLWTRTGTVKFRIKPALSHSFSRTHAIMPAW